MLVTSSNKSIKEKGNDQRMGFSTAALLGFIDAYAKQFVSEDMMSRFIVYSLGLWGPVTGEIWLTQELPKQHAICHVLDDCGV